MNPGHQFFALRNALNDIDLGMAPAAMLLFIYEEGGTCVMEDVYAAYGIKHGSHLRRSSYVLDGKKLITRRQNTEQGGKPRRGVPVRVELTAKGRKLAERITAKAEEAT